MKNSRQRPRQQSPACFADIPDSLDLGQQLRQALPPCFRIIREHHPERHGSPASCRIGGVL
jgi:hypothetical protein